MKTAIFLWLTAFLACLSVGYHLIRQGYETVGFLVISLGFLVRVQVKNGE